MSISLRAHSFHFKKAGCAAVAMALTLSAQDSQQLQRLSIGRTLTDGPKFEGPGRTWHLSPVNATTTINSAYRYKNEVVIFGWAERAGLTTIIDTESGEEQIEFLALDPVITQNGLIVFKRFYPA